MIRIKNIRAGVVLFPGLGLRLAPGGVAKIQGSTPEVERAIAAGLLVRLESTEGPVATAAAATKQEAEPAPALPVAVAAPDERPPLQEISLEDLLKLPQAEAIQRIAQEEDLKRLRAILAADKRPRVQDAIRRRISEAEAVAPR